MARARRVQAAIRRCTPGQSCRSRVNRQAEAMKAQQQKIEDLTGRVIRLEAQLELLAGSAMIKKLKASAPGRTYHARGPIATLHVSADKVIE